MTNGKIKITAFLQNGQITPLPKKDGFYNIEVNTKSGITVPVLETLKVISPPFSSLKWAVIDEKRPYKTKWHELEYPNKIKFEKAIPAHKSFSINNLPEVAFLSVERVDKQVSSNSGAFKRIVLPMDSLNQEDG